MKQRNDKAVRAGNPWWRRLPLLGQRTPRALQPRGARPRYNLRNRMILVGGTLGLCALALAGRALDLQVINNDFYRAQGDQRILREIAIPTSRGM
ncbi:MAG: hypothetical protein KY442_11135, partial [Proteobacteria bacterium]|nr:hypothetical protein [Pseudomonadota bacterium]